MSTIILSHQVNLASSARKHQRVLYTYTEPPPTSCQSATALYKSLEHHNARSVALKKIEGVVEINSTTTPIDAAKVLWENNILSCPVFDEKQGKYVGIFDIRDILSAVISSARKLHKESEPDEYTTVVVQSLEEYIYEEEEGMACTLSYLISRNPFHTCKPDVSLVSLCKLLSKSKCRRVLICVSDGQRCINMISRSSLIKYLSEHTSSKDLNEKIKNVPGLDYRKDVVSVRDDVSAFEAFKLIDSKGLYGIAVVDEDGQLVGNTSARDVKLAALDKGRTTLELDILSYLATVRQRDTKPKSKYPICYVREDATVGHLVNLLAKTGYHRVFVVDNDKHPIGVISETDILQFTLNASLQEPPRRSISEHDDKHVKFGNSPQAA